MQAVAPIFQPSISVTELMRSSGPLRDLKSWYIYNARDMETVSYFETKGLRRVLVVDEQSADPGIGQPPVALDEDHISISKVISRSSHLYQGVRRLLTSICAAQWSVDEKLGRWPLPTGVIPVGRDPLVAEAVRRLLDDDRGGVLFTGGPAIGKTTVALAVANQIDVVERFGARRGLIRLDQEGAVDSKSLMQAIAAAVAPIGIPPTWEVCLTSLTQAPALLVLDNLETPWERDRAGTEGVLRELLSTTRAVVCATLRGSERPCPEVWKSSREIDGLDFASARDLFERISGVGDPSSKIVDDLIQAMDGIPLAIELMAEQAQFTPLPVLWEEWVARRTALLRRSPNANDAATNLEVSIDLSLASPRVTVEGATLFRMLGRMPAGLIVGELDVLLDGLGYEAASSLRRTRLAYDHGGRIVLLSPVREYSSTLRLPDEKAMLLAESVLEKIRTHGPAAGVQETREGVNRLAEEGANLDEGIRLALDLGLVNALTDVVSHVGDFQRFSGLGQPATLVSIAETAQRAGNKVVEGRASLRAGEVFLHRSDYEAAIVAFNRAEKAFKSTDERISQATCTKCAGDVLLQLGRFEEAAPKYCSALRGYRRRGSQIGEANCWSRLAEVAILAEKHPFAARCLDRADALYSLVPDFLGKANCTLFRALIATASDQVDHADSLITVAAVTFEELGDLEGVGNAALGMAEIAARRQALQLRDGHLRAGLEAFIAVQNPQLIGEAHKRLAEVTSGEERKFHLDEADRNWRSVNRLDLLSRLER
jgi:tetratricopeptide (TPR) repeat protein